MAIQYSFGLNYRNELIEKLSLSESTGFKMQEIPDYQFSNQGIRDFHDIVERPLFFKVRKPITPITDKESGDGEASEELEFLLTGVISTPKGVYCLLQNPREKEHKDKFRRLEQGDEIDGWAVKEIHPDHVVMTANGKTEKIQLAKPRLKKRTPKKSKRRSHKPKITPPPKRSNPFKLKTKKRK